MVWSAFRSVVVETCVDCWAADLGPMGVDEFEYVESRLGVFDIIMLYHHLAESERQADGRIEPKQFWLEGLVAVPSHEAAEDWPISELSQRDHSLSSLIGGCVEMKAASQSLVFVCRKVKSWKPSCAMLLEPQALEQNSGSRKTDEKNEGETQLLRC